MPTNVSISDPGHDVPRSSERLYTTARCLERIIAEIETRLLAGVTANHASLDFDIDNTIGSVFAYAVSPDAQQLAGAKTLLASVRALPGYAEAVQLSETRLAHEAELVAAQQQAIAALGDVQRAKTLALEAAVEAANRDPKVIAAREALKAVNDQQAALAADRPPDSILRRVGQYITGK